ncbi:MAG: pyruvate kinase [Planctomycetota bacterium]
MGNRLMEEELAVSTSHPEPAEIATLLNDLERTRLELVDLEIREKNLVEEVHPAHRRSARNLLHYLGFRRRDARHFQPRLAELGLSSLGRAEAHVLATIDAVLANLHRLAGSVSCPSAPPSTPVGYREGTALLELHADQLFGPCAGRTVRIMVTMPSEAAEDYPLVRDLVAGGMDVMRINCAHDGPREWERMVVHLHRARRELGRVCRILMDLGGPKLRTGSIARGPEVLKWRPQRDVFGRVTMPARVWLTSQEAPAPPLPGTDATLPVPADWLKTLKKGNRVTFKDARGASRALRIVSEVGEGRWAECGETAYVVSGTQLKIASGKRGGEAAVGRLPAVEQALQLRRGDTLVVTRRDDPGLPAERDARGVLVSPATISCTLPEVFADVRPGERIWFDDGRIGGIVRFVNSDQMHVEIVQARLRGETLKADKGINLPDSTLRLPSLTARDIEDLPFVARRADMVGYSFVREPSDVATLQEHLAKAGGENLGLVLKIETRAAFEKLPHLLLAAMRSPSVAVMIARGDLAVEMGYERLAEVQEEILWICEAAHVPVIWATQVLESLAKDGVPSRAEITDAAMGERAECVMLNKGAHVLEALRVLNDILLRMQGHLNKKSPVLRQLRLARDVLATKE